jgi:hypothetical protein
LYLQFTLKKGIRNMRCPKTRKAHSTGRINISSQLSRFDFSMIVFSLVVGVGMFATPGQVAQYLHNGYLYFAAWIIGGVVNAY